MKVKNQKPRKRNYPAHLSRAQGRAEDRLQRAMNGYNVILNLNSASGAGSKTHKPVKPGKMHYN